MLRTILCFMNVSLSLLLGSISIAQGSPNDAVIFIWNDTAYASAISRPELVMGSPISLSTQVSLPNNGINVTQFEQSPLTDSPADGYGFYQGVWSDDGETFAYLIIEPDGAGFRVMLLANGQQNLLFSAQVDSERAYLVPIGWTEDRHLILLERYMLHNLRILRLWQYDEASAEMILLNTIEIPFLHGNSVSLGGAWVFVGFDTIGLQGYLLNLDSLQIVRFSSGFALEDPPRSVFEIYPIEVIGIADMDDFRAWLDEDHSESSDAIHPFTPFLYWSLPDFARSITCYPDSEWTDLNFAEECPGLAQARAYQGHQGTDIGGRPNGLALGTPVYAAAKGIVIETYALCESLDIGCHDSYGNTVLIEHTLIRNHNTETWFTGYAHLRVPLVEAYTYIGQLGIPIALSGDTGLGGAHLHIEVRSPMQSVSTNWINPWDDRFPYGGLWIGGNEHPVAAVSAFPSPTQLICQSGADNNIRTGPDITYEIVGQTAIGIDYEVFQIQTMLTGEVRGDWYQIRWDTPERVGWVWADLMQNCVSVMDETSP